MGKQYQRYEKIDLLRTAICADVWRAYDVVSQQPTTILDQAGKLRPLPPYYSVPKQFSDGSAASMAFWDALYYAMATEGWTTPDQARYVTMLPRQLSQLSGLSARSERNERIFAQTGRYPHQRAAHIQLAPRLRLQIDKEGDSFIPHSQTWILPEYEQLIGRSAVRKPSAFVYNGWLAYLFKLKTRYPLRILNLLFSRPYNTAAPPQISFGEILQRCRKSKRAKVERAKVLTAVHSLSELNLLKQVGESDQYQLVRATLDHPCPQTQPPLHTDTPQLRALQQADPATYTKVIALAQHALIDLDQHLAEMVRDLRYVREDEFALLLDKVGRQRWRPPARDRWRLMWAFFCEKRRAARQIVRSAKVTVTFADQRVQSAELRLPIPPHCNLRYAKALIWLNDDDFILTAHAPIEIRLDSAGERIWQYALDAGDVIKRKDLTALIKRVGSAEFNFTATADRPMPNVSLAIQIEAACFKAKEK